MAAETDRRFVPLAGGRVECVDIPGDAPELLLLHEGLGSISMWRDFPRALAASTGRRTIAYSRFGFGRSSPRPAPFGLRFMHEEAQEILPELRSKLSVACPVLVGHSTGASIALLHAGADPATVAGVVAMAPLVFIEESNLASIAAARAHYARSDWREKLARHHDDVDAVFRGWSETWLDPRFRAWDIRGELAAVRCPLLGILGEADPYSTFAQLDAMASAARNAASVERLLLPGCGHAPHRESPHAVLEAIGRFVADRSPRDGEPLFGR